MGVAAAGPAGPAKVSPGPLAGHQLAPTPGPESKSQATADGEREVAGKGFRTSRSDEEIFAPRPDSTNHPPPARPGTLASTPANAAHRPTAPPLRLGPPPQEPQASERGWSAEIPAATFTDARTGFPAAVSGSGEGKKGVEGGGGGRGTLVAPESPRGARRGPKGVEYLSPTSSLFLYCTLYISHTWVRSIQQHNIQPSHIFYMVLERLVSRRRS